MARCLGCFFASNESANELEDIALKVKVLFAIIGFVLRRNRWDDERSSAVHSDCGAQPESTSKCCF